MLLSTKTKGNLSKFDLKPEVSGSNQRAMHVCDGGLLVLKLDPQMKPICVSDRAQSNEREREREKNRLLLSPRSYRSLKQTDRAQTRRRRPACVLLSTHASVEAPADTEHVGAHESRIAQPCIRSMHCHQGSLISS